VARARRRWMREQGMFGPAYLVFVDEIAANTKVMRGRQALNMTARACGWWRSSTLHEPNYLLLALDEPSGLIMEDAAN